MHPPFSGFCQKLNEEQKTSRLVLATTENYSFMPSNFEVTRVNRGIMQFSVEGALAILINGDISKERSDARVSSAASPVISRLSPAVLSEGGASPQTIPSILKRKTLIEIFHETVYKIKRLSSEYAEGFSEIINKDVIT